MRHTILLPALLILLSCTALAQNNPIFFGGPGDGIATGGYIQPTDDILIHHGGFGDGATVGGYTQNIINYFTGGSGDGYALSASGMPLADRIFYGGLSDGYGLSSSGSPTIDKIFFGGLSDGFSSGASGPPNADRIFFGGLGDGWSGGYFLSVPLPLDLLSFTGKQANGTHLLNWQTTNATEAEYFELERATSNNGFKKLGTIKATGEQFYQYTDSHPLRGDNFYRLKQVGRDGKLTWSNTVLLKLLKNNALIQVYPNPAASVLYITLNDACCNEEVLVDIYNAAARLVKHATLKKDNLTVGIDVQAWAAGVYSIRIIDQNEISVFKFVKQ